MSADTLSATFAALADPTRRAILARLSRREMSVKELARPFDMSGPAITKHLKVLERARLIVRSRHAQWRPCRLKPKPLKDASDWLERYRELWEERLDRLEDYLQELQKRIKPMTTKAPPPDATADRDFVISRLLNAPRELVWQAWTQPKHLMEWWGPRGIANSVCEIDVRPGGALRIVMRGPDGNEYPVKGVFREVKPPERLVFTMDPTDHPQAWHDLVDPNRQGAPNPAGILLCIATMETVELNTKLTVRIRLKSAAIRDSMAKMGLSAGWSGSLDRLEELLPKLG